MIEHRNTNYDKN